jgi:catechol 2,3-dioxygenase-like lactoylglutathione lyase family enzyme
MSIKIGSIVIRCYEFDKMYEFWKEALGYEPRELPKNGWVVLEDPKKVGPNISLDQAPNKRLGKRSWLHLDLYTNNSEAEIRRLELIGAKPYPWRYPEGADYKVLEDPDGNLFCVISKNI